MKEYNEQGYSRIILLSFLPTQQDRRPILDYLAFVYEMKARKRGSCTNSYGLSRCRNTAGSIRRETA